jgi:hypothetical protein
MSRRCWAPLDGEGLVGAGADARGLAGACDPDRELTSWPAPVLIEDRELTTWPALAMR